MTAQEPDIVIDDSGIELGWLKPYFVRSVNQKADSEADCFPVPPVLPASNAFCSSLWRGYVATMRLHPDGRLELVKYDFPYATKDAPAQICNAYFTGDFSITFRPFFFGPNTVVPFRDGMIVRDRDEWDIDEQVVTGVVSSVICNRENADRAWLLVDFGGLAYVPRSLVPFHLRDNLEALVGQPVVCSIHQIDDVRGNIILQIIRLAL